MSSYSVQINEKVLDQTIRDFLGKSSTARRAAYNLAYGFFYRNKQAMLKEFNRHPVTNEIAIGPHAANISDTLDGYGNLSAFIGFQRHSDPIGPLRELLDIGTTFRQTIYKDKKWYFRIDLPSRKALENITPMPWEGGNSWAFGIERGISGLSHFMYKKWLAGRSGGGFQLPYENLEDATFHPRPYLTQILANFREKINNIS